MKEHDYDNPLRHYPPRAAWRRGPWDQEPDREQWRTEAGLPGLIVRNRYGALCGYVAVPPDHPLHGVDYHKVDVDVHGGLTYADRCWEDGPICHVPEPGEPDDVWWFGFDCAHAFDLAPGMFLGEDPNDLRQSYKDFTYVRAEVEGLARQLKEAA